GAITAHGSPKQIVRLKSSLTGLYLSGTKAIPVPTNRRIAPFSGEPQATGRAALTIIGARQNNLKNIDVAFPLGAFIVVTGVSGSGKSSLIHEILYCALTKKLHRASVSIGAHDEIRGWEN